jgi:hypothetical protein
MSKKAKTKTKKKVTKKFLVRRKKNSAPVLSEAAKRKLSSAATKRQLPMTYKDLNLTEMSKVQQWTAVEGGFQRQLSLKQVNEVTAFMLYSPTPVIPPILLAKIKGDRSLKRWCIDGQHRLKGALQAGMGIPAVIITVDSLEQARYLFLIYNSKASKVSKKFIGMVSNNEVATLTRALSDEYEAYYEHIKRLGIGLLGGKTTKYWDEVAHDASVPAPYVKQMRTILDLWTSDRRWTPEKFPEERPGEVTRCIARKIVNSCKSAYCVPGVLQVVGAVVRDLGATTTKQITTIVDVAKSTMRFKSVPFRRNAGLNGMETWCDEIERLKTNVAKHTLSTSS